MYIIDPTLIFSFSSALLARPQLNSRVRNVLTRPKYIANSLDVTEACYAVYESGVPFQTANQRYMNGLNYITALDFLAKKIYKFFNNKPNTPNTEPNFDQFHEKLCDGFLDCANTDRRKNGVPDLTYGNAQKLVNMIFKYLTTFNDYPAFSDLFEHCHMPIDGYILAYLCFIGVSGCTGNFNATAGRVTNARYFTIPWTGLTKDGYQNLVSDYRIILSAKYPNFTMLNLEYYFWDAMQRGTYTFTPVLRTPLPGTITAFYI